MQTIEYYTKQVYGIDTLYIKDVKVAQAIQTLTGKKTLTPNVITGLTQLGYKLTEVLAPKNN